MRLLAPALWAALPVILLASSTAHAASLGPERTRFRTNDYHIDLFQGPVLGGARMTGLAGAYAPIAEGVAGFQVNPASPAVRPLWSRTWFDWDWDLGVTFPNTLAKTDFDNNGSVGFQYSNFLFFTAGLNLQFGEWGMGFSAQAQQYDLGSPDTAGATALRLSLLRANALLARSFFDGQLVIGAGFRAVSLSLAARQASAASNTSLFATGSAGSEGGILVAPLALPMRLSLTARSVMAPNAASSTTSDSVKTDANGKYVDFTERLYLPTTVELPWEVDAAVAIQIGRPLNQQWINTHHPPVEYLREEKLPDGGVRRVADRTYAEQRVKAKYDALPRQKLLVVASILVSGPVQDAIGVESFLSQRVERSGEKPSITPRMGIEAEPFANAIQVRAGSYLEPSRFRAGQPRLHGTLGLEARLFRWSVFDLLDEDTSWRLGAYGDVARNYFGWGLTAGIWY